MTSLGGRPSDPTRSFFLKVDGTKVRCIDGKYLVSDKIERLRNHRKRCHSVSGTIQREYDLIDLKLKTASFCALLFLKAMSEAELNLMSYGGNRNR